MRVADTLLVFRRRSRTTAAGLLVTVAAASWVASKPVTWEASASYSVLTAQGAVAASPFTDLPPARLTGLLGVVASSDEVQRALLGQGLAGRLEAEPAEDGTPVLHLRAQDLDRERSRRRVAAVHDLLDQQLLRWQTGVPVASQAQLVELEPLDDGARSYKATVQLLVLVVAAGTGSTCCATFLREAEARRRTRRPAAAHDLPLTAARVPAGLASGASR